MHPIQQHINFLGHDIIGQRSFKTHLSLFNPATHVNEQLLCLSHLEKWGLDFIGSINPPSSVEHIFILNANNDFSKWSKAISLKNAKDEHIISFLEDTIFSCFGVPLNIILNNGPTFVFAEFSQNFYDLKIKHSYSSSYYP